MAPLKRIRALAVLLLFCCTLATAQLQAHCADQGSQPCVDKIDPPNWWAALPSPMLLLHGVHLDGARFTVSAANVTVTRTLVSGNGHYAFLWLNTDAAAAQEVKITVASAKGSTAVPFQLQQRKPASEGFRGFSAADVTYLIMTDRFADGDPSNNPNPGERSLPRGWHGGDFRGIEQHLDYLQQLGVTTIWTTPAYDNSGEPQAYHGYSTTDFYRIDPHFGTLADYQHLAGAIHRHGMKIVLDTVPNHVGPENPWLKDPPAPDWFHGTAEQHDTAKTDFQSLPDPHASWLDQHDVTEGWFANVLPDLNQENPLVKQYLIQNVIWWVETVGLDGLRYDTFPYVGRAFWHDLNAQLHDLYPQLTTVGEVFSPDPTITSFFAGGVERRGIDTGLYTPFDFPVYFELRSILTHQQPMSKLEDVLREDWLYPHPERLVPFIGNHDTTRFLSQPGVTVDDLKLALGIIATIRGMPQIYSGDEIAMRGGADPDNRHDFPGGFPGDAQNAFTAAGRTMEQAEVHDWVASLLHFRIGHAIFATGEQQDVFFDDTAFGYVRTPDQHAGCNQAPAERYLIAVNNSDQQRNLKIHLKMTALDGCSQFTGVIGSKAALAADGAELTVPLEKKQLAVFSVK
jgi:glycosidase